MKNKDDGGDDDSSSDIFEDASQASIQTGIWGVLVRHCVNRPLIGSTKKLLTSRRFVDERLLLHGCLYRSIPVRTFLMLTSYIKGQKCLLTELLSILPSLICLRKTVSKEKVGYHYNLL